MDKFKILVCFIALINFEIAHSFNKFVRTDKELIYSWTADVKAGTYLPTPYASQFVLQGKIHLQAKNDSVLVKITDLTHRLYNGIIDQVQEHKAKDLPVPEEVADLENVFRIVYNEEGLVEAIGTTKDEKQFSRNIKRAIATILQLNVSVIGVDRPESFIVQEKSIYGHGEDVYSVFPQENQLKVHKLHRMEDTAQVASYYFTNIEPALCDVKPEKILMHDSQKRYFLVKEKESFVVKHIHCVGSVVYNPFKARSESHIILVNQSFQLINVNSIKKEFHVVSEHLEHSLSYHSIEENPEELNFDGTNGRSVVDYEKLIPLVQNMLKDIPQYLREDHFNTEESDTKRGQLINRVQRVLLKFSFQKLEELQKTLPEESLNIFYHILPLVGTDASSLFVKVLICEKKVNDETAVTMLQGVPEIIKPSLSLIHKLKDLIHLDESFSWEIRKVAILSFGSIIHKSYLNHANLDTDLQKPYQKYVDEYIDKVKKSDSYSVQFTYLLGLRNMKLPFLADRLHASFNGEWFQDRHLRLTGIWAAAPSIISSGPEKVIETLWPIFTNRRELTELRLLSYYYIMYSRPSVSMLRNIFASMLTEPDEEVYRFHYELSHSLMQSKEPCHQDFGLKVAQIMKLSPAPVRGSSYANFFGYHYDKYGFSAGVQNFHFKTNVSRMYGIFYTTQQFNLHEEKYFVYLKVHDGKDSDPGLLRVLNSLIYGKCDCHVEASVVKSDRIINTYVLDRDNVHELLRLAEVYFKFEDFSSSKDLLYMNYDKFQASAIPTDLGIPAIFEYLTPEVHHNNFSVVKTILNESRGIDVQFRNKLSTWSHFHHGLSFYNPISDTWQGINRVHSFDVVLPVTGSVSLGDDIRLTIEEDPQKSVIGLRSNVKQVIFARSRDYYQERVLSKFLADGHEFQDVGQGHKHKQNCPWIDEILTHTGHHASLEAYESDTHLPLEDFQNKLSDLTDPKSLYYNTPWEYIVSAYYNIIRYISLQPEPGSHGVLLRIEPSDILPVTQIEVVSREVKTSRTDESNEHSLHFSYAAKSQNVTVRSWDLEGIFGYNFQGDSYHWDLHLTRTVPGKKDYKVCVDGSKRWLKQQVEGFLKIRIGESVDHRCVNDTVIKVLMKGEKSQEQIEGKHKDASCQRVVPFSGSPSQSMQCLFTNNSLRHYTYDVNTKHVSKVMKKSLTVYWEALKNFYNSHYHYKLRSDEKISDGSFKVDVLYPLEAHQVNIKVDTSEETYQFPGIPTKQWKYFGLAPDSTVYPYDVLKSFDDEQINYCHISSDHYTVNKRLVSQEVPKSWKVYLQDRDLVNLSVKFVGDRMAVRLIYHNHSLELIPDEAGVDYSTVMDERHVPNEELLEDWMYYRVFTENHQKVAVVFLRKPFHWMFLKFDHRHLDVMVPKGSYYLKGLCLESARN